MSRIILPRRPDTSELMYRLRNFKAYYDHGKVSFGHAVARRMGVLGISGSLSAVVCKRVGDSPLNGGRLINLGLLGRRVVTSAGVNFLVDDWDDDTTDITTMNFHDSGTGNTAENSSDTTLDTQAGPTTRVAGTKSQPSANILQSVGTIDYGGTLAIVEHGLFNQSAQGGTLWDRTVFSAINVVDGDSIQFTYQCTLTAGS